MSDLDAQIVRLRPHVDRVVEHRDGLAEVLHAIASGRSDSSRPWLLERLLYAVPAGPRSELVTALIEAADQNNSWWTEATGDTLRAAVALAADAATEALAAAYEAGAR